MNEQSSELLSLKELFMEIVNFWNSNDLGYIILAIAVGMALYFMIVLPKINIVANWKRLVAGIISFFVWCFVMYIVIWPKMEENLLYSGGFLIFGAISSSIATFFVLFKIMGKKDISVWNRIIAGTILGMTVFSVLALFAYGHAHYGFTLVMGVFLGVLFAQIIFNINRVSDEVIEREEEIKKEKEENDIPDL